MTPDKFLTPDQQEAVINAIRQAETSTSGEIRIHIDGKCKGDPVKRAEEVFTKLGMHKTELRNGVLIYLACDSKVFAIVGDKGINDRVPGNFWKDVIASMEDKFRQGLYAEGLTHAVSLTGEKLQAFFPYSEDDVNEQPDEISMAKEDEL